MLIAVSQVELYWQNLVSGTTISHLESESSSVGRASAFQAEGRRFEPGLSLQKSIPFIIPLVAGWSSQVARRAHNPKVEGSNPSPATNIK